MIAFLIFLLKANDKSECLIHFWGETVKVNSFLSFCVFVIVFLSFVEKKMAKSAVNYSCVNF